MDFVSRIDQDNSKNDKEQMKENITFHVSFQTSSDFIIRVFACVLKCSGCCGLFSSQCVDVFNDLSVVLATFLLSILLGWLVCFF